MKQENSLLPALEAVAKRLTTIKKDLLENSGIPEVSMAVCHYIDAIDRLDRGTMGDLAKHMGYSKSSVTIMVDKLQRSGFVEKVRDVNDLRVYHILLTDKGQEVNDIKKMAYGQFIEHVDERLSTEERKELTRLLQKIS